MAPLDLLMVLLTRALLLSMPIGVGVLAFRRLMMSQTSNVWLYALTVGYAAFTTAGLAPWAMGLQPASTVFVLLAMACPMVWMAIVVVCGMGRDAPYDKSYPEPDEVAPPPTAPLLLTNPVVPEPVPVFRHHRRRAEVAKLKAPDVLGVARAMRGRSSSEPRRTRKLLPPPAPEACDLPFLR